MIAALAHNVSILSLKGKAHYVDLFKIKIAICSCISKNYITFAISYMLSAYNALRGITPS